MPTEMTAEEALALFTKPINLLTLEEAALLPAAVRVLFPLPNESRQTDEQ